jgi:hypothetical protein
MHKPMGNGNMVFPFGGHVVEQRDLTRGGIATF